MATSEFIQQAYIAFFNRPADASGYTHWLNHSGPDQDLLNQFADSAEYLSDFAGKTNREIIGTVYQNLFGRQPEAEGWDYWEAQMDAGWVTVGNAAYEILGGAKGTDLATINNKTTAAETFTNALNSTMKINAYAKAGANGLGHLAKEWLATVSHDNLATAQANHNNVLNTLVNANTTTVLPKDNVFVIGGSSADTIISTNPNVNDTIKWNGSFDNGLLTALNFATSSTTLDFTAYSANWLASANLNRDGLAAYWIDEVEVLPDGFYEHYSKISGWHAIPTFHPFEKQNTGDKYLTLTRTSASTTEYKIELWTVEGEYADAYCKLPFFDAPDTSLLIGYVDLGCAITVSKPSVLENIIL